MIRFAHPGWFPAACLAVLLSGCETLIGSYDATYDQALNKLSEDSAKFLAAADAGGPQRSVASKEAVEYYAASANVLDRLTQRAAQSRGSRPCGGIEQVVRLSKQPTSSTVLPAEHSKFDCREVQLYSIRYGLEALGYAHRNDGQLNADESRAVGGQFQRSILQALPTFIVNKPQ